MEKNRIVLFNILKKRTKCILQSLQDSNNNLIREVRELLEGISGISDEELERIETVEHLWEFLVRKKVISKDEVQVLEHVAEFLESRELGKEVKDYKNKNSGKFQGIELSYTNSTKYC